MLPQGDPHPSAFTPTEQQDEFRTLVSVCVYNSRLPPDGEKRLYHPLPSPGEEEDPEPRAVVGMMVADWIEWGQYTLLEPVAMRDWQEWARDPAFMAWFIDEIPALHAATEFDLRTADALFWREQIRGLTRGSAESMRLQASIIKGREVIDDSAAMEMLEHIREARRRSKWRAPTDEERYRGQGDGGDREE